MTERTVYVKEYFEENYAEQYAALRDHYHARTRDALQGRKIDTNPVPNATTIVYLHDDGDGGVYVTTGDFVEYFNRRYGDSDRIGAMRRSLANAERKGEKRRAAEERRGNTATREDSRKSRSFQPLRTVRPRFALLNALLVLMLVLSVGILGGTAYLVDDAKTEVALLEEEVAMLEATSGTVLADQYDAPDQSVVETEYPALDGEDAVYHYPAVNGGGTEWRAILDWCR